MGRAVRLLALSGLIAGSIWFYTGPGWTALRDHSYFKLDDLVVHTQGSFLSVADVRQWLEVACLCDPSKNQQ